VESLRSRPLEYESEGAMLVTSMRNKVRRLTIAPLVTSHVPGRWIPILDVVDGDEIPL
jgi:hypothetical protein